MDQQTFKKIVKKGENQETEFKINFDDATIMTLVAFANAKGGRVFIGVIKIWLWNYGCFRT